MELCRLYLDEVLLFNHKSIKPFIRDRFDNIDKLIKNQLNEIEYRVFCDLLDRIVYTSFSKADDEICILETKDLYLYINDFNFWFYGNCDLDEKVLGYLLEAAKEHIDDNKVIYSNFLEGILNYLDIDKERLINYDRIIKECIATNICFSLNKATETLLFSHLKQTYTTKTRNK